MNSEQEQIEASLAFLSSCVAATPLRREAAVFELERVEPPRSDGRGGIADRQQLGMSGGGTAELTLVVTPSDDLTINDDDLTRTISDISHGELQLFDCLACFHRIDGDTTE